MSRKYQIDPKGHVWELNDDGGINIFALSDDIHNGPRCANCGYDFCHHCTDTIEPCPAAKEARTPQDVKEFIAKHAQKFHRSTGEPYYLLPVEALVGWMSGHVRVPVEVLERMRNLLILAKCHDCAGPIVWLDDTGKPSKCGWCSERYAMLNASKGE